MAKGSNALRYILKRNRKFKKAKVRRFNKSAAGCPMVRGIVVEKVVVGARQPNSADRKCTRVRLVKNGKTVTAFAPGDGAIAQISEHDTVLLAGAGGRLGRSRGDCCGVSFKILKVNGLSLRELVEKKAVR